jgi:hypothetical protein
MFEAPKNGATETGKIASGSVGAGCDERRTPFGDSRFKGLKMLRAETLKVIL